jgi:hypothetical protein
MIPELISRIDYRKGPYFAEDGDFASAGSANIGYLNRLERPLASLSLGQNGYQRLLGAGSTLAGAGTLLGAIELNHNDGPWQVPQNFRKLNAVASWSLAHGDDSVGLTAMGYSGKWTSTDQVPKRAVDAGLVGRFGSLDPTDGGESSRASLSLDWKRALADGAFQLNAYAVRSRLDLFSNFTFQLTHPFDLGDPSRRPVPAVGEAQHGGPECFAHLDREAWRCGDDQQGRPASCATTGSIRSACMRRSGARPSTHGAKTT